MSDSRDHLKATTSEHGLVYMPGVESNRRLAEQILALTTGTPAIEYGEKA